MLDIEQKPEANLKKWAGRYFWISYIVVLANTFGYFSHIQNSDAVTFFFAVSVYLVYSLAYTAAAFVPLWALLGVVSVGPVRRVLSRQMRVVQWGLYIIAVAAGSFLQVFLYADRFIYNLYNYHINGFVWNLVTTEGGIESLGSSDSTMRSFSLLIAGFVVLQIILLAVSVRVGNGPWGINKVFSKKWVPVTAAVLFAMMAGYQAIAYGISNITSRSSILSSANVFPYYVPVTFKSLAARLGYDVKRSSNPTFSADSAELNYPIKPLELQPDSPKYNVVWLVAESWRADMLDPEIMPATWKFSQQAIRFKRHYSSGIGTRMGIFSMFYGLYGSYWFSFLAENRSPVLMDLLQDRGYAMKMFTSAMFSYPEFDRTVFARIPSSDLVERVKGISGWENDRLNISQMLDFIRDRDVSKPFMTFMFFESPHANYYFPPESVIRPNYLPDLNYATMNLARDAELIKNRYINSCHHLDSQFERVFNYLAEKGLLENTIVVVTGDHGEEFMEKGHWGHNSEFTEEQCLVPLVLKLPGRSGEVYEGMSSHLDIPAMLLPMLGVKNPSEDYSLGINLLANLSRTYTVVNEWDVMSYICPDFKMKIGVNNYSYIDHRYRRADDSLFADESAFEHEHISTLPALSKMLMIQMKRFSR